MAWQERAACASEDSKHNPLFFSTSEKETYDDAREFCKVCPVTEECLEYAMERNIEHGCWGGLSPYERRKLHRRRTTAARKAREKAAANA